jgi:hypothetical protein
MAWVLTRLPRSLYIVTTGFIKWIGYFGEPPYDPEFPRERVFESYLLTLVEAWLRDLAYHWKSENPPGSEELGRAGLLEKLEGGTTQRLGA